MYCEGGQESTLAGDPVVYNTVLLSGPFDSEGVVLASDFDLPATNVWWGLETVPNIVSKMTDGRDFAWGFTGLVLFEPFLTSDTALDVPEAPPLPVTLRAVPSPFRARTAFLFETQVAAAARLRVFDVTGREVARPVDGVLSPGAHRMDWSPVGLSGGVFFYRLELDGAVVAQGKLVRIP